MQPNPNNNLSVLPWYRSLDEQNARRWWVYGRIFPLFCPATNLIPFQIMRDTLHSFTPGADLTITDVDAGYIGPDGQIVDTQAYRHTEYAINPGTEAVLFTNLCSGPGTIAAAAYSATSVLLGVFEPQFDADGYFSGGWVLPSGTASIIAISFNANLETQKAINTKAATIDIQPVTGVEIYTPDGTLVGDYSNDIIPGIEIKSFQDYDVIIYPGENPFATELPNGQYFAKMTDGTNTWYSEVFTVVNDLAPYLKIVWYDQTDFVMDAGTIVYTEPSFRNVLYLDATLAKPEYPFEEEGENRDGYFFPVKQISEKRYRFKFFAAEYLLDVMRFIRMADFAFVEYLGKTYNLDTFLITPEWEANGDVASVEAVFDTDTVAKKIGVGYIKATE